MDALDLARWQFGITTVYHFIFVPLTIGLSFLVAGMQTAWVRTKNERYLRNETPLARVGLVYSQQTYRYYGGTQPRQKVEDYSLGYYHALVEAPRQKDAQLPFSFVVHDIDSGEIVAHTETFRGPER